MNITTPLLQPDLVSGIIAETFQQSQRIFKFEQRHLWTITQKTRLHYWRPRANMISRAFTISLQENVNTNIWETRSSFHFHEPPTAIDECTLIMCRHRNILVPLSSSPAVATAQVTLSISTRKSAPVSSLSLLHWFRVWNSQYKYKWPQYPISEIRAKEKEYKSSEINYIKCISGIDSRTTAICNAAIWTDQTIITECLENPLQMPRPY